MRKAKKPRSVVVEKNHVLGQSSSSLNIPEAPSFYPNDEEFQDPLKYISKIGSQAEPYGICKIVPPKNWKPPFAIDLEKFTFPTKTQAIHQLQVRVASCDLDTDTDTFELEYNRFLGGKKKSKRDRVVFEGEDLDLCKLFNAVKKYGGYDKVVEGKKWGEVFRVLKPKGNITEEGSNDVLCQLYREYLYDYESFNGKLSCEKLTKKSKRVQDADTLSSKKRRKNCNRGGVKNEEDDLDELCEQCESGLHGEVLLLCDKCNKGWHIYCLSPPLKEIPPGNWYCLECVNSDSFGFVPGKQLSLETFRRLADKAKKKWFGSASPSRLEVEKKFWEIVDGSAGEVEVMYGNDLDTSTYGSGFPRSNDSKPPSVGVKEWDTYSSSPWNLNNLPKLQGSMLQAVHNNIAGVMVPWLYIGMLFSSFCWHFEDHCFYSTNYLHWGEPKCWYSVPGSEAQAFDNVMRKCLPDLFDAQPDLLFQLVTMLNPSVLQENGVPVYTVLQEPGNFVITFPRAFHGGFNFGLNCAEAVNFAPADWFPHGGFGAELYRLYHKADVLSHEELLYVVAKRGECNDEDSPYLKEELLRVFNKEKTSRERLWRQGIVRSSRMSPRKHPEYVGSEEDPTCIICKQYLYLSAVFCTCRPSSFVCLEHSGNLCECKPRQHRLLYRQTLAELNDLIPAMDKSSSEESTQNRSRRPKFLLSEDLNSLAKKGKGGGRITHAQLAEEWILKSFKVIKDPFSNTAYANALKEAEQFLWAGAEMDPVRDVEKNLLEAKKWALDVTACLSKIETWFRNRTSDTEKVAFRDLQNLLSFNLLPCNETGHLQLKAYAQDASELQTEITSALSASSQGSMNELENLHDRATELPVHVEEIGRLEEEISSATAWIDRVKKCVSMNSKEREDQENIVQELSCIVKDGQKLRVRVDELPLAELELKRALWKVEVKKLLLSSENPLIEQVQRLMKDGSELSILPDDQFMKRLVEVKHTGLQWCDEARRVASDCGELKLDEVSKLIAEGENLPVQIEKEVESSDARSVLYCICRKPYDNRAMIACDSCDEWYHFDCINLHGPAPETYYCHACKSPKEESPDISSRVCQSVESDDARPQTPSPCSNKLKRKIKPRSSLQSNMLEVSDPGKGDERDQLCWRNQKSLKRTRRKRAAPVSLSPL